MTIEIIGLIALLLGFFALRLGPQFAAATFIVSTLLGASAAVILPSLGGANIQPAYLLLGFLTLLVIANRQIWENAVHSLAFPRAGFWLLLTVSYGALTAMFFPRVFSGLTFVFAIERTETGVGIILRPLAPVSGNITQTAYFVGDLVCFLAVYALSTMTDGRRAITNALLATATLNLGFGVLDLVTYWTGTTNVMGIIRNSTYRMLSDGEIAGMKRIVGSFTEASAFAYTTLGLFAFTGRLWLAGFRPRPMLFLSVLSLVALLLATSSTGYGGLAVLLSFTFAGALVRVMAGPVNVQTFRFVIFTPILACVLIGSLAVSDATWQHVQEILNTFIFGKMDTQSGIERAAWNTQAIKNFQDTMGLGAGIGSLRASSFLVAVLACLGIVGALLYAAFLCAIFFGGRGTKGDLDEYETAVRQAARSACFAQLVAASVAGSFVDLGLPFFIYAGLACAPPLGVREPDPSANKPSERRLSLAVARSITTTNS